MKTAKDVLKQIERDNGGDLWFAEGDWEIIEKAMKAYASQAIDEAANRATIIRPREAPDYLDRDSILKIKDELK